MGVKSFLRKIILGHKCDSESFLNYYREKGARIGARTTVFEPTKTFLDETRPFLIEIGDDVQITRGVTILTHGYDWSVLKGVFGEFFWLFHRRNEQLHPEFEKRMRTLGNHDESQRNFENQKPQFDGYE